jgi:hypothetical protein
VADVGQHRHQGYGGYAEAVLNEFRREGGDDEAPAARLRREGADALDASWLVPMARIHEKRTSTLLEPAHDSLVNSD